MEEIVVTLVGRNETLVIHAACSQMTKGKMKKRRI